MMRPLLHRFIVYAYVALCCALMIVISWCLFVDTKPPIQNVAGKVVSFNPTTQTVLIEWTAVKNRRCGGWRYGWMRETHTEPPARLVEYIDRVRIPPAGFKGTSAEPGTVMTWRTDAVVPPSLTGQDVIYVAEWEYSCNALQELIPLVVESPLIEIKPQR